MFRTTVKILLLLTAFTFAGCAVAYYYMPDLKWRLDVMALTASGQIEDLSFGELLVMIKPGSGFWLQPLAETRNPYSSISNPFHATGDLALGEQLFESNCTSCHGSNGTGDSAPSLDRKVYSYGDSDWSLFTAIRSGIQGTSMPSYNFGHRETWSVVAYLQSLRAFTPQASEKSDLEVPLVTADMLAASANTPENWLTYSGSFSGQRFSGLDQISKKNASQAAISWIYQFSGTGSIQESSPIVVSGIMYLTEAPNTVHALDASTGKAIWSYSYKNESDLKLCCGAVNRGLAILGETVFMGTLDSKLVALNSRNGELRWIRDLHDHRLGTSITAAPLAIEDKIIVGYGGGDLGIRGSIDAVNSSTGTDEWRLFTIPADGEPGNDTWAGDSWATGGAATWLTGSFDPESRLLYWTTGNPAPDYQGDLRLGDNLYSCSVLAIDVDTGRLKWHFQFTPHDERDWDSNQIPVLVDRVWNGQARRLLLLANRNAFFYVLDRDTGEFLLAKPFAKQNWAIDIDSAGRPIINPDTVPSPEGKITWPSPIGATNWQSPSYSPRSGLMYVPTLEFGQLIYKDVAAATHNPGDYFLGGRHTPIPGAENFYFSVRALDPETGNMVWEYGNPPRDRWWKTSGLVSTNGGVVFGGDGTDLFILDDESGKELWRKNVGGRINASPITYEADGKQFFAIAAGRSLITVAVPDAE